MLSSIETKELLDLEARGRIRLESYVKDRVIHLEGDTCERLEVIVDGKVCIQRIDNQGNYFTIAELGAGDVLGGGLLFSQKPDYPMTITATKNAKLISLDKPLILDMCSLSREFLEIFLSMLSDNTQYLSNKIKKYSNRTLRDVIVSYLNEEYSVQKSLTIKLRTTKKEVAESMGVARTSLSRELQRMKKEGLIDYSKDFIVILDLGILIEG